MIKVCGLALYGLRAASTRYRLNQYAQPLREEGISLDILPLLDDEYLKRSFQGERYNVVELCACYLSRLQQLLKQKSYDLAIIQAELFPLFPGWLESWLLKIPYIYDLDDAFFLKYRSERFASISPLLRDKFNSMFSHAAFILAGNQYLLDHALSFNSRAFLFPTVVDVDRYVCAPAHNSACFTVGWVGSPSTSIYLKDLVEPLARLGRESPVRFIVVGAHCEPIENVEVVNIAWSEETEIALINTFDVGVMPMFDNEWARGKCAFKLIQYMACGVPVVASAVGANLDVVTPDCGLIAADCDGWVNNLRKLRDDELLRRAMGKAGRRRVEAQYSLRNALPIMTETIRSVAEGRSNRALAKIEGIRRSSEPPINGAC